VIISIQVGEHKIHGITEKCYSIDGICDKCGSFTTKLTTKFPDAKSGLHCLKCIGK